MAVSSSVSLAPLFGNLPFSEGGISTDYLVGAFIKSAAFANGVWTLTFQNSSGVEKTSILSPGWVVAAVEPSSPYEGQGWYDTTSNSLKLYNGTAFASLTGTGTVLADGSVTKVKLKDGAVTPPKLDAGDETKQDAFLARLNALRRDLNNIATLTIAKQRTLLLATGTLIDGARPAPSAAYSGRTWIDDHDDRAYVCRNRQEVSSAVGGLWSDAATTTAGIEIAERLADLDDPASVDDYAYTYSDNKWWRGAVRNMQNVWRETQPTTALSGKLTLTPNWNTVWLGKHRWDYNATQQLPHSALPAMTDYYFYNTRTVTVRKLTLADYSAAGTVFDHWQWEPLVATAAEIDIIEARDGNLPALASDGTDDRQIAVANDGLHFVRLVPEAAVAATVGTWTSYIFEKSNPTRRYIGVVSTDDPPSGTVGDFYYNSTFHRWRIYAPAGTWAWFNDHWEDLSDEDTAWPVRFVGHHATRAEAVAYAASSGIKTGETFVAFTGSEIETASQFNAGSSARFSRHWRFLPVGVAGAPTTDNDDYLNALAFAVTSGVVSAKATLHDGDEVEATGANLLAPLASPVLTGEPKAPTPLPAGVNTQIATKKYVDDAVVVTDSHIRGLITGTELSALSGSVTNDQIPDGIMRDSELTADAIRGLLDLTAQEVEDLLTGASISGQVLTYTTNEGVDVTLTIPDGTAVADGVVASGVFSTDGRRLTLTLDTGVAVVIAVPAPPTPTARGVHWGRVTFSAKADGITDILVATDLGYTPASDTPTGMAKVDGTITLPVDPPSDEIIGLWFVGSANGTDEVMSRLLLWGSTDRTANSQDIYFSDGKVIRVIMARSTVTGAPLLTFQQIDGAIVATQTIDIYPVVTSGGAGERGVIIRDNPGNRVAPSAANEENLLFRNNNLFRQSLHHGTAGSITWAAVSSADIPAYEGAEDALADLPLFTTVGEVHFVRRGGHFVKAADLLGDFVDYVPPGFIGSWTNQADATRHATKVGDIAGFIASSGPNTTQLFPYIVSAYVAPTKSIRIWVRTDGDYYFGFRVGPVGAGDSRILELVKANGVADRIVALGVEVVFHATRASYNLADPTDGKLHIVTVV